MERDSNEWLCCMSNDSEIENAFTVAAAVSDSDFLRLICDKVN